MRRSRLALPLLLVLLAAAGVFWPASDAERAAKAIAALSN